MTADAYERLLFAGLVAGLDRGAAAFRARADKAAVGEAALLRKMAGSCADLAAGLAADLAALSPPDPPCAAPTPLSHRQG